MRLSETLSTWSWGWGAPDGLSCDHALTINTLTSSSMPSIVSPHIFSSDRSSRNADVLSSFVRLSGSNLCKLGISRCSLLTLPAECPEYNWQLMSKTPEPGEIWAELWVDQGTEPTFSTQHSGPRSSPGLLREHSHVSETHCYGFGTEMETKELRALKEGNIIYLSVELRCEIR